MKKDELAARERLLRRMKSGIVRHTKISGRKFTDHRRLAIYFWEQDEALGKNKTAYVLTQPPKHKKKAS